MRPGNGHVESQRQMQPSANPGADPSVHCIHIRAQIALRVANAIVPLCSSRIGFGWFVRLRTAWKTLPSWRNGSIPSNTHRSSPLPPKPGETAHREPEKNEHRWPSDGAAGSMQTPALSARHHGADPHRLGSDHHCAATGIVLSRCARQWRPIPVTSLRSGACARSLSLLGICSA